MVQPNLKTKSVARKLQVVLLAFLLIFAVSCEKDETVMPADPQAEENGEMAIDEVLEAYSQGTDEVEGDENARKRYNKKRPTFRTLIVALAKTNLIREVSFKPRTVFAPTDKAFAELGLYPWNIDDVPNLKEILLYHVVEGRVFSNQFSKGFVPTLNGAAVEISFKDGYKDDDDDDYWKGKGKKDDDGDDDDDDDDKDDDGKNDDDDEEWDDRKGYGNGKYDDDDKNYTGIMVNDAKVKVADIRTFRGVVHVIDKVLSPPDKNLVELAQSFDPEFSILVQAVIKAELTDVLATGGAFTVFAPTNAAFVDLLDELDFDSLDDIPVDVLKNVLLYHVVEGRVYSSDLMTGPVTTLNGTFNVDVSALTITDANDREAGLIGDLLNFQATNGVVHAIDRVILPEM